MLRDSGVPKSMQEEGSKIVCIALQSTELLLAMVDSRREAVLALLPPLMRLGLQELLTDLLECETTAINEGSSSYGYV